jgi:hypothetical protein
MSARPPDAPESLARAPRHGAPPLSWREEQHHPIVNVAQHLLSPLTATLVILCVHKGSQSFAFRAWWRAVRITGDISGGGGGSGGGGKGGGGGGALSRLLAAPRAALVAAAPAAAPQLRSLLARPAGAALAVAAAAGAGGASSSTGDEPIASK